MCTACFAWLHFLYVNESVRVEPGNFILSPVVTARMGGCNGLKNVTKELRDVKKGGIRARKAGLLWGLSMKKSTLQVRLNRRVTFDREIEVHSPSFLYLIKNEEKKSFAEWLIELANGGFGMSTDAFLKSVKKFPDKGVILIYYLTAACVLHHTPVICYVLFHDANARLYV